MAFKTYYLDHLNGDDANSGLDETQAWRSLERLSAAVLLPGSQVLLASGQCFPGVLRLTEQHSGSEYRPISLTTMGAKPAVIDAGNGPGLIVEGCHSLRLSNLSIRGSGRKRGNTADGVLLKYTHSVMVTHTEVAGFRGAGIRTFGDSDTRLEYVYAHDNGFAGISVDSGQSAVTQNLYIGYCIAENNPGDPSVTDNHSGNGIVVSGVQRGLIEYCEAMHNGWDMPREGNGPVGIWGWHSDDLTIQYCISHGNLSPGMDGGGFDFDGGVTRSVMQYNLSHHNAGAGYGLYQFAGAAVWQNNTIRYNVSLDDGHKNSQSGIHVWSVGENISDADIYSNLILNHQGHGVSYLHDVPGLRFWNNRFITGGEPIHGEHQLSDYIGNVYSSYPAS